MAAVREQALFCLFRGFAMKGMQMPNSIGTDQATHGLGRISGCGFPDLGEMAKVGLQKFRNFVVKLYNAMPWGHKGGANSAVLVEHLRTKQSGDKTLLDLGGFFLNVSRLEGGRDDGATFVRKTDLNGTTLTVNQPAGIEADASEGRRDSCGSFGSDDFRTNEALTDVLRNGRFTDAKPLVKTASGGDLSDDVSSGGREPAPT